MSDGTARPAYVDGDDGRVGSRRRLVYAARASTAAALIVLALGLVLALREPADSRGAGAARAAVEGAATRTAPAPDAAYVILSPRGTVTSPVVWEVRAERDGGLNAVLSDYEDYVGTVVRLTEAPDPDDVALPQVALDPQLGLLQRVLAGSAAAGTSRRGRVIAVARVVALRGELATVISCLDSSNQHVYGADGRLARARLARTSGFSVRMRRDDGRWKVLAQAPLPPARCQR